MSEEFCCAQRNMPEPDEEEDEETEEEEPGEAQEEFDALLARTFAKLKEQQT